MLDEALLRPGRLEVQVEIGLADEKGRHQILKVGHLATVHQTTPTIPSARRVMLNVLYPVLLRLTYRRHGFKLSCLSMALLCRYELGRGSFAVRLGLALSKTRLQIHTGKMQQNSFLGADVDLWKLAQRTKNFSGAEIEGLVKSATSFALNRQVDVNDLSKPIDEDNLKVSVMLSLFKLPRRTCCNKGSSRL